MINEAFWFFYFVGVVGNLIPVFGILIASGLAAMVVLGIMCDSYGNAEVVNKARARKWIPRIITSCVLLLVAIVFVPSQKAMYAGATQFVVQETELDGTLMNLKTVLDQKIESLIDTDHE